MSAIARWRSSRWRWRGRPTPPLPPSAAACRGRRGPRVRLAAPAGLALHWARGWSPVEDLTVAGLLGWIDPPPGMTGPEAAAAAEDPVRCPPAGPATEPSFDNEVLAPLIAACARADGADAARRRAESALRVALSGQLTPTWGLMWRVVGLLRTIPPADRLPTRWDADKDAFTRYAEYLRDRGLPQPRRDSAVAAARRLDWLERALAGYAVQRALDDPLVMAEYRMTGEAFAGTVTAAQPGRIHGSGKRRKLRPLITVATEDPVRVEAGTALKSPGRPGQNALVVSVSAVGRPRRGRDVPGAGGAAPGAPPRRGARRGGRVRRWRTC